MVDDSVGGQGFGPAPSPDRRGELVLEEARRDLDQQKKDLEGLRNRAFALLGFSAVVASLLGRFDFYSNSLSWLGLIFGVGAGICCGWVLRPQTFTFSLVVSAMDARIDQGHSINQMLRDTALGLEKSSSGNQQRLRPMHRWFRIALLLLGVETILLLIGAASR